MKLNALIIIMALLLALPIIGCGGNDTETDGDEDGNGNGKASGMKGDLGDLFEALPEFDMMIAINVEDLMDDEDLQEFTDDMIPLDEDDWDDQYGIMFDPVGMSFEDFSEVTCMVTLIGGESPMPSLIFGFSEDLLEGTMKELEDDDCDLEEVGDGFIYDSDGFGFGFYGDYLIIAEYDTTEELILALDGDGEGDLASDDEDLVNVWDELDDGFMVMVGSGKMLGEMVFEVDSECVGMTMDKGGDDTIAACLIAVFDDEEDAEEALEDLLDELDGDIEDKELEDDVEVDSEVDGNLVIISFEAPFDFFE